MKRSFLLGLSLIIISKFIWAQSEVDDYWLNNGFVSGDTIYTNSGHFYDDGGFDVYNENQDWQVTICSENGNPLTVDFSNFRTHFGGTLGDGTYFNYDYMTVEYPGADYVVYHDDTPEFSFTSPSTCMDIGFHSDGDGQIDSGWVAEIFALPAPANNDPVDAAELIVGNVCSPSFYSNKGAYSTTDLGSPSCKEFFGGDVWFRLVVPASGTVRIETFPGTLTYAILDIFSSANSTIDLSERILCVDDAGAMPSVTLSGPMVSPGETIYIRLFGEQAKSGLFGICASDPSAPVSGFTGPGGVGDSISLDFWYKADQGLLNNSDLAVSDGEAVKSWTDHSGNDQDLTQTTTASQALFAEAAINGFPSVNFDGLNDNYQLEIGSGDSPLHWFAAASFSGAQRQTLLSMGDAFSNRTASISMDADYGYYSYTGGDLDGPALTGDQLYLFHASHLTSAPYHFLELDAVSQTVDAAAVPLETDGSLQLGTSWDNTDYFNGGVSELIQYRRELNTAQVLIVNNYLAVKYNIDIGVNDLYSYNNSYHYDLAGIGRINADNTHTKAQSAGILSISGASDLGDNEFLFFGHDNGDISSWNATNIPAGDTNILSLGRLWRTDMEGATGSISIGLSTANLPALPTGYTSYVILVDSDADFSGGTTVYGGFNLGNELVFNNVTLNDGDLIGIYAIRPMVSFTQAESESLENVNNPHITVELNYPFQNEVQVDYIVSAATASQGADFSLLPGNVTISPGTTSADIIPLVIDDDIVEIPDEYFEITISTATAGVSANGITTARHTILNDDLELTVIAQDSISGECTSSTELLVAIPSGTGPFTYSWSPTTGLNVTDNDSVIANPTTTTNYTVEVTDFFGNTETASIELTVVAAPVQPVITADGPLEFCEGNDVTLTAPSGYANYLWSNLAVSESILISTSGDFTLVVTDTFGCSSPVSATSTVSVNAVPAKPVLGYTGPSSFCDGESIVLEAPEGFSSYLWSDLSTADTLNATVSGEYFVAVTNADGCTSENSDTAVVTVYTNPAQPEITVDGATAFCGNDSVLLSVDAGYPVYHWSNGNPDHDFYVTASGSFTVSVEDANGCISPLSDQVDITVYTVPEKPSLSYTGETTFCEGGSLTLEAPSGYTGYLWSNLTFNESLDVTTSGSYYVAVSNADGCVSENSDTVDVTVYTNPAQPEITVDGATAFCGNDSVLLSVDEGYPVYHWSNGNADHDFYVTASGSFTVSVEDANGCISPLSDQVDITVYTVPAKPSLSYTGETTFCEGGSLTLEAPSGYTGYLWSNLTFNESLDVTTSGSYYVAVSNADGCVSENSDTVDVTVNLNPLQPVILSDGNLEFCEGDSVVLSLADSYSGYVWNDGSTESSRIVKASGDFSLHVEDENGCLSIESEVSSVIVNANPAKPAISVSGDLTFCEGGSVLLESDGPYADYNWQDGTSSQARTISTSGDYFLTVSDANGCESPESDVVQVEVFDNPETPVILVSGELEFCEGDSVSLSIGEIYPVYEWSNGNTDKDLVSYVTENYSVHVIDENGCQSAESEVVSTVVNSLPAAPVITANGALEFCEGGSVDLSADAGFVSYLWNDGETGQTRNITETGTFTVLGVDANGCSSDNSADLSVQVNPVPAKPLIEADGPLYLITGDSVHLSTSISTAYLWAPGGETSQEITVTESGDYTVTVWNEYSCESEISDPLTVTVSDFLPAPEITVSGDPAFCAGGSVTLSGPDGFAIYQWSNGETDQDISVANSSDITLVVFDEANRESLPSEILSVTVYSLPILVQSDSVLPSCAGYEDGLLEISAQGAADPFIFEWEDRSETTSTFVINGIGAGNYEIKVTDANDCVQQKVFQLTEPDALEAELSTIPAYCPDASDGEAELEVYGGTGTIDISWNTGSSSDRITDLSPGDYSYTVTDDNLCAIEENFTLGYENEVCFEIPGIITPFNHDGLNDTWIIPGLENYPMVSIEIFDRWGKRVYLAVGHSASNAFDGTFNGEELPMASYHYVINLNNGTEPIIGNLTILR